MNGTQQPTRLRAARAEDAQAIGAVFAAAVLAEWDYFDDIESMVPMFGPEHWDDLVTDLVAPDLLMVAELAGEVVGFVATHAKDGELYLLFVHPDHVGRGIGRQFAVNGPRVADRPRPRQRLPVHP